MDPSPLSEAQVKAMKVSDLKAALSARGLPTNGVKASLQARLGAAVKEAAAKAAAAKPASKSVDDAENHIEEEVDESTRLKGTVFKYEYRRGFGLITPEGGGKNVYVHWKQIQSSDTWPALTKGMDVEYYLGSKQKFRKQGVKQSFAAKVTGPGGAAISISNADLKKTFPDESQRFAGEVKFFHGRKGYGFIKPKTTFEFQGDTFEEGKPCIYVAREDVMTDAAQAAVLKDGQEVEFTLYKRENAKQWGAGNVTKSGGEKFVADDFGQLGPKQRQNRGGFGGQRNFKPGSTYRIGGKNFMMMPMMSMGGFNPMSMMMGGMGGFGGGGKKWGKKKGFNKSQW